MIDMQDIVLPGAFASEMLNSITFSDNGGEEFQRMFNIGLTVESETEATPEPASVILMATGLIGIVGIARRRPRVA